MPIRRIDRKFKIMFYHIFKTLKLYDFWFFTASYQRILNGRLVFWNVECATVFHLQHQYIQPKRQLPLTLRSLLKATEDENNKIYYKMDYNSKPSTRASRFLGPTCFIECTLGEREHEAALFMGNKIIRKPQVLNFVGTAG